MMRQAPFGHDRAAARDNPCHPLGGQRNIGQAHTGMDGEIIHPLLGLFDQGILEHLPGQVLGNTIDLFQGLIDRHGPDWHRAVTDHPVADIVNIAPGRQVHDRIAAPANGPDHLINLVGNRGQHSRIADIGIDLDQEIAANNHRLQLAMIDIGRNNRPAAGNLFADKFRRDEVGDGGAKVFAIAHHLGQFLAAHVFADGDVFHFRRNDPGPRIGHLGHGLTALSL